MNIRKSVGISVRAIYGAESHRPLVVLALQDTQTMIDPIAARKVAMDLMTIAEASEQDAFLMEFFMGPPVNADFDGARHMLVLYREWRAKRHAQYEQDPDHTDNPMIALIHQLEEEAKLDQYSRNADQKKGYLDALEAMKRNL